MELHMLTIPNNTFINWSLIRSSNLAFPGLLSENLKIIVLLKSILGGAQ